MNLNLAITTSVQLFSILLRFFASFHADDKITALEQSATSPTLLKLNPEQAGGGRLAPNVVFFCHSTLTTDLKTIVLKNACRNMCHTLIFV